MRPPVGVVWGRKSGMVSRNLMFTYRMRPARQDIFSGCRAFRSCCRPGDLHGHNSIGQAAQRPGEVASHCQRERMTSAGSTRWLGHCSIGSDHNFHHRVTGGGLGYG